MTARWPSPSAAWEMYRGDQRLTGREWNLAIWFMLYGDWEEDATAEITDGELIAVNFTRTPQEDHHQEFEFVGTLSGLFSSMYLSSTSDADRVTRLGIKVVGGSLGSLIPDDYESDTLPLWRIHQIQGPLRSRGAALRFLISNRSAPIPLPRYVSPRSIRELVPARGLAIAVRLALSSAAAASMVSATSSPIP